RHHCPQKPTSVYDHGEQPFLTTEYVENYPKYSNVSRAQSLKPKQEYQVDRGKMEATTTFKSDYIPYEIVKRNVHAQEYKPIQGERELGTTYQKDYNAHKIQPVTLIKPLEKILTKGKFETVPTYQDDYRLWEVQRKEPKIQDIYQPPTEKFGNSTTFQDDFVPKEMSARQSCKPPCAAKVSDVPFDGTTSHRSAYKPHQLEPNLVRPREEYRPSNQPFEYLTTHRNDFKGLPGQFTKSCKPDNAPVRSSAHFNGVTEFQENFQPWLVSPPQCRQARGYVPPPGNMDLHSTSHQDYIKHEVSPAVPIRPVSSTKKSNAPFQDNTTTKDDYRAWSSCRQEIMKKREGILQPTGKFYDLTTFKSHYIPHQITPNPSCKPVNGIASSSTPFEDQTMYRTEYKAKKQEICPANYLSPPGYRYLSTDSRGHKFFRQLTPVIAEPNTNPVPKEVAVVS
ncbi:SAXO2 protein, partial [Alcedo cyanopectus]|nr:SAXO2 protein [Ceyx cyanopectus]